MALVARVATIDVSSAGFRDTTESTGSHVAALVVQPATNAQAAMTVNVLPLLTCRVVITWAPSSTPGVASYEVVRVVASSGAVAAGPWTVTGATYTDAAVPLQLAGSAYAWQVRALAGTWRAAPAVAVPDNALACLL